MKRLFILLISSVSLAATYPVTSALDAGPGTLREAITLANGNVGLDVITFNFGAATTITLASCLPNITDPISIDGYSEPSSAPGTPSINVVASCINGFTLAAGSTGSTIQGIILSGANRGLYLWNSSNHIIQGNQIGTNAAGTAAAATPILWNGIELDNSNGNLIGGLVLGQPNLISGCNEQGIRFQANSSNNIVRGNLIGTNKTGTAALPNAQNGIMVLGASNNNILEYNLISGNGQRGIFNDNAQATIIRFNLIGTLISGNAALGNATFGIEANGNSHDLIIQSNIIGSNTFHGIFAINSQRLIISSNRIGLGFDGTSAIPNGEHGIMLINCLRATIGGSIAGAGNYISNNTLFGMNLVSCDSLRIRGNFIGLDIGGITDRGNALSGINIDNCRNPRIGGSLAAERNFISGNNLHGISINGATSDKAYIRGNVIGLGTDLSTPIGNGQRGIELINTEDSYVGGTTATERNYISSNNAAGLFILNSDNTVVSGNYVGIDGTGLLARGNAGIGIVVENSNQVTVGGSTFAHRNIVCANDNGIVVTGSSANGFVRANFVGLGADGTTMIGNDFSGIYLLGASSNITVGGSTFAERNVCSGNGYAALQGDGIRVEGPDNNIMLGNYCGVDSTGTIAKPNYWAGISLNESSGNIVGGSGLHEGNICSANLNEGIYLRNATNNQIIGNYVGTDKSGTLQLGNEDWGINIGSAGPNFDNIIGGSLANRNIIAYNKNVPGFFDGGPGVFVYNSSHRNLITYNKIYCNEQRGIERNGAGNDNVAAPVIVSSLANDITGTGDPGFTVHIYRNTTVDAGTWCDCEGETFIGTTVVDGSGNWTFTHSLGLSVGEAAAVSATQTNAANSTSPFSTCSAPLPVEWLEFTAKRLDAQSARLQWYTLSETNNKQFSIMRSVDGIHFESIATLSGAGTSIGLHGYEWIDRALPEAAILYYRIKQEDWDGKTSYSNIRSISSGNQEIVALLSSSGLDIGLLLDNGSASLQLLSSDGKLILSDDFTGRDWVEQHYPLSGLANGMYILNVKTSSGVYAIKLPRTNP
ncbi:MAG: right-handed parallel beta-helix repeat-containing protein [Cytophagaceae bacterium]|nr:right-handed parallel beta-helix repeat-containing protein [Cytophagaceae bacterium]